MALLVPYGIHEPRAGNEESDAERRTQLEASCLRGSVYKEQQKLTEAQRAYEVAIRGYKEIYGKKHVLTLEALEALGSIYRLQNKPQKAEKILERVLRGREEIFGKEHLQTLDIASQLCDLYLVQGQVEKSGLILDQLPRWTPHPVHHLCLGDLPSHRLTRQQHNGHQEVLDIVLQCYKKVLQCHEEVLGTNNAKTLRITERLGKIYWMQNKLPEATQILHRILQARESMLCGESNEALHAANMLGEMYFRQDQLSEAEQTYKKALRWIRDMDGGEDIVWRPASFSGCYIAETVDYGNKAPRGVELHMAMSQPAASQKMLELLLLWHEEVLGTHHARTLSLVERIGEIYQDRGRLPEATQMLQRALQMHEAEHNKKTEKVIGIASALRELHLLQGHLGDAEQMYKKELQYFKKWEDDDATFAVDWRPSYICAKPTHKSQLLERLLPWLGNLLGADHRLTLDLVTQLYEAYRAQDRLPEATQTLERAVSRIEEMPQKRGTRWLGPYDCLSCVYLIQDRLGDAEHTYKMALQHFKDCEDKKDNDYHLKLWTPSYIHMEWTDESEESIEGWEKSAVRTELLERLLPWLGNLLGADHRLTLDLVTQLYEAYRAQDRLPEATQTLERAILRLEETSSERSTAVLDLYNYLSCVYTMQGRLEDAEHTYKVALLYFKNCEEEVDNDDDDELDLEFWTPSYIHMEWTDESEESIEGWEKSAVRTELLERLLPWLGNLLGADHRLTLDLVTQLYEAYRAQDRLPEATQTLERAVSRIEEMPQKRGTRWLGPYDCLSCVYLIQDRLGDAEHTYKMALQHFKDCEDKKDNDYHLKLWTPSYIHMEWTDESEESIEGWEKSAVRTELLERLLPWLGNLLGADHRLTLDLVTQLYEAYRAQDRLPEATQTLERAILRLEETSSERSTAVLDLYNYLSCVYTMQGRLEDAEHTYKVALLYFKNCEEEVDNDDDDELDLEFWTPSYIHMEWTDESEESIEGWEKSAVRTELLERLLPWLGNLLGADHRLTLDLVTQLYEAYRAQDRLPEATQTLERAILRLEETSSERSTAVLDLYNYLSCVYTMQGRLEDAEHTYKVALLYFKNCEEEVDNDDDDELDLEFWTPSYIHMEWTDESEESIEGWEKSAVRTELLERLLPWLGNLLGADHRLTLDLVTQLYEAYRAQDRLPEATQTLERAILRLEETSSERSTAVLDLYNYLSCVYTMQGRLEDAEHTYKMVAKYFSDFGDD